MTENAEKFLSAVSQDTALQEELEARLKDADQKDRFAVTASFAVEKGYALSEEDLQPADGEMDSEELDTVTGGGKCVCALLGLGLGDTLICECTTEGGGRAHRMGDKHFCVCAVGGYGKN